VVPQWVCEAPEAEQELIVLHEREHIRAHDQLQLLLAIVSTVLMPWNPFTWLQSRKLRFTVETDCDQRVLAAAPDHARYASLLVNVGTKQMGLLLTPALAEHRNGLERRLGMLGAKLIQNRWKAAGLMVTGVLMTVAACESRLPQDATEEVQATEQEVPITADRTALELEERELVATPANGEEPNPSAPKLRMRGMQPTPLRPDASLPRKVDPNGDPHFTPHTTRPEVANRAAVGSALKSHYPPLLRNAGIGGTSTVWLLIDEDGKVMRTRLAKTSGRNELDAAALRVAQSIEFTPAQHEGNPVRVWIQLPIVFKSE
jgi:TonB family protein